MALLISSLLAAFFIAHFFVFGQAAALPRIRFLQSDYTFLENEPSICLEIIAEGPMSSTGFAVFYSIDASLTGASSGGPRDAILPFRSERQTELICISIQDDNIPCEPAITGTIQLRNSSSIELFEPSTAFVTIRDNDPAIISFESQVLEISENIGIQHQNVELLNNIPNAIIVAVTGGGENLQSSAVASSLPILNTEVTLGPNFSQRTISLRITDDSVALEDPEETVYMLSVISTQCSIVRISPFSTTTVRVFDDDVAFMELSERNISVKEDDGTAEVCVLLSTNIAKTLHFNITTHSGTATEGEDYSGGTFRGRFEAYSSARHTCVHIPILRDGIIENPEEFTVTLSAATSVDSTPQRHEGLRIGNAVTTITIKDLARCTGETVFLDPNKTHEFVYIQKLQPTCFTCALDPTTAAHTSWTISGHDLERNYSRVLPNGVLFVANSSHVFSLESSTQVQCTSDRNSSESNFSFQVLLGEIPTILSLTFIKDESTDGELRLMFTCIFDGQPRPNVRWLFNGVNVFISDPQAITETVRSMSVLTILSATANNFGNYTCIVENEFGNASQVVSVNNTKDPVVWPSVSGAVSTTMNTGHFLFVLIMIAHAVTPLYY